MPLSVIAVVGSIWLTSGSIFRLITPSPSTVGVKASPTPYFLNSIPMLPRFEETGIGNSPPARKLAVSPESAVRFGSARRRTTPRSSSACSRPSACTPLAEHAADDGAERRGARDEAGHADRGADAGAAHAEGSFCTHLPVDAELAARGARRLDEAHLQHDLLRRIHLHGIDHVGAELLGDGHRLVDHHGVRRAAGQHDAAVHRGDAEARMRETLRELAAEPRGIVGHLDVEHADQLLGLAVNRDARGADLLAEHRERAIGEGDRVGDIGIADDHLGEALCRAHAFGLADRDLHGRGHAARGQLDLARLDGRSHDAGGKRGGGQHQRCPQGGLQEAAIPVRAQAAPRFCSP